MITFGHGVSLDTIDADVLPDLREWRNNYEIWKYCRQNDLIPESAHQAWFQGLAGNDSTRMYLVRDRDGRPVGVCGLTSIDSVNRRAEFSLYIAAGFQGCGIGKAALSTLLSHGFRNLGLNVIWGESFDGNPALKMFKKLGFKHEGVRREFYFRDGEFIDAHLVSIKAKEWAEHVAN